MRSIAITPLKAFQISVEAENISSDRFAPLTLDKIRGLEIWQGNRKRALSDLFRVEGDDSPDNPQDIMITLQGDFSRVKRIAEGMTSGIVVVHGSAGMHAGNNMSGGLLSIKGNADDWLGREMRGGKISVSGSAGNYIGSGYRGEKCGMRGGEIEIGGSVGAYLGEHLCGGSIRVAGDAGDFPGAANQGGTIYIGGSTHLPGAGMTKGTITVKGKANVLPGYQKIETTIIDGEDYQTYSGDLVENGKGELFIRVGSP